MSAHASTLSLTYVKLSPRLFLSLTLHPTLPPRPRPSLSVVLHYKHIYTLSLSSLLTLTVTPPSSTLSPLSSLICIFLMPCQSEQHHQNTEGVWERQEGDKTRQIHGDTRRHKKAEDIWSLAANSITDDKLTILFLLMEERGGDKQ